MTLTRKHFELVAEAIRTAQDKSEVVDNLCLAFKSDNFRFDKDRFIQACYGGGI